LPLLLLLLRRKATFDERRAAIKNSGRQRARARARPLSFVCVSSTRVIKVDQTQLAANSPVIISGDIILSNNDDGQRLISALFYIHVPSRAKASRVARSRVPEAEFADRGAERVKRHSTPRLPLKRSGDRTDARVRSPILISPSLLPPPPLPLLPPLVVGPDAESYCNKLDFNLTRLQTCVRAHTRHGLDRRQIIESSNRVRMENRLFFATPATSATLTPHPRRLPSPPLLPLCRAIKRALRVDRRARCRGPTPTLI